MGDKAMRFVKKLYIMTGRNGRKGAVTVERNALGCPAKVTVGDLPKVRARRYFAFISDGALVFPFYGNATFDLGGVRLSPAHVAIVRAEGEELTVELYGTDCEKRMWESNLCDYVRGKILGFERAGLGQAEVATTDSRTGSSSLSILGSEGGYDDNAIAKVNYYSNVYSTRSDVLSERERMERLGADLLGARFDLPEEEAPTLAELLREVGESVERANLQSGGETDDEDSEAESGSITVESVESEDEMKSAGDTERESAATVSASVPMYARYVNDYRERLLRERTQEAKGSGGKKREKPSKASDESVPTAPKSDDSLSRRKLEREKQPQLSFYEKMKGTLDKLFESNPREELLERLLPVSRFVRVSLENSDKYYCVGLLGRPDYICYAVPSQYTPEPPEELDGYCQWLPRSSDEPQGQGFWLIYQDAETGESVKKN